MTTRYVGKCLGAAFLVMAMASPQSGRGRVTALLRENITIYDESGAPRGKRPNWTLPKGGSLIVGEDTAKHVGIKHPDGSVVYLRNSEIETKDRPDPCAVSSNPADRRGSTIAASEGIGSGMSGSASRCIN